MPAWHAVPQPPAALDGPPIPHGGPSRRAAAGNSSLPVVVVPDIYGPSPFYWHLTQELARAGHPATLVDHHFREGPLRERSRDAAFARRAGMDEVRAIDDLAHAVEAIRNVTPTVGLVGFCLGGQLALDLAATRNDVKTVGFYPFPEGVGGEVRVAAPRPVDLAPDIDGPVLCFWGEEDYIAREVIDRFGAAMYDAGADYEAHVYPAAGHSFLQGLVEDRPDSEAARDAWRRTLAFLSQSAG